MFEFTLQQRRRGSVSTWLLLALPVLLAMLFVAVNVHHINYSYATQEIATDASALAAGQAVVTDTMLVGTLANIAGLETLATSNAQAYANLNPVTPTPITYAASDIEFTTIDNPYDPSLKLIDTITVTSRRTAATSNPVPIFASGLFSFQSVNLTAKSKSVLDRRVAGMRPVFSQNLPLAPIAFLQSDWATQVETAYAQPPNAYVVTLGGANVCFLQIGTASEADLPSQLTSGVTPSQISGAPFGGQFVLDTVNGLSVPILTPVTPLNLKATLDQQVLTGKQFVWPLYSSIVGSDATVVRLVAARVTAVNVNGVNLDVTLQPTFLSDPSVVTESTRDLNLYVCRLHLTN